MGPERVRNMVRKYCLKLALMFIFAPCVVLAQDTEEKEAEEESDWEVMLAAGLGVMPTYEGSVDYALMPIPYAYVNWRDFLILGPRGLTANLFKRGDFTAGAALTFNSGRDEEGSTFFGSKGNNDLLGMGDIGAAAGAKVFATYDFPLFTLDSSLTRYLGQDNDGFLAELQINRTFVIEKILRITPSIELSYADKDYMQTFFGVSPEQAVSSRFDTYGADAGIKDVSLGLNVMQMLNRNWFIFMSGKAKFLMGDAEDSPISRSNINGRLIISLGYRF